MGMGRRSFDLFEQGVVGCEDTQIRGAAVFLCLTQPLYHNSKHHSFDIQSDFLARIRELWLLLRSLQ